MLRLIFWFFLFANGVLFAYRMGYLDSILPRKSEPQRVASQLNPEKIRLLPPGTPLKPVAVKASEKKPVSPPPSAPSPVAEKPKLIECVQVGEFPVSKRRLVEKRLARLKLGVKPVRKDYQEPTRFMVYLPPQGGVAGAGQRVKKLQSLGISNYFIIKNKPGLHGGISLGVFSSRASAERYRKTIRRKGVKNVQVSGRKRVTRRVAYQLRAIEESKMPTLKKMMRSFPKQKIGACPAQ